MSERGGEGASAIERGEEEGGTQSEKVVSESAREGGKEHAHDFG
jgi:hypothetical protein